MDTYLVSVFVTLDSIKEILEFGETGQCSTTVYTNAAIVYVHYPGGYLNIKLLFTLFRQWPKVILQSECKMK